MKVKDIFESNDENIINTLVKMANGGNVELNKRINLVTNTAMKRWPACVYSGPMFRLIKLNSSLLSNMNTDKDLLSYIKEFKQPHNKQFVSWTKKAAGVASFFNDIVRRSHIDPDVGITPENVTLCVIVQQTGTGFDFAAFVEKFPHLTKGGGFLSAAARINEVVAMPNDTLRITGFTVIGLGNKWPRYNDQDEDEEDRWDMKMIEFKPEQFPVMKRSIMNMRQGQRGVYSKVKKPHPKSQLATYSKNRPSYTEDDID